MTDKKALRQALLAKRATIGATEKAALDRSLCAQIAAHPYFPEADALLCYLPVRGEPDLTPLFALAADRSIPVYLPRCEGDGMRFLLYTGESDLVRDRFGILAPAPSAPEACPTAKTLCVMPGLSADKNGTRLGYGGGFYDRFLPRFAGKMLFPLYECMLCDALPREACDFSIPQNAIITEKGALSYAKVDTRATEL